MMRCALVSTVLIVFVSGALQADDEGELKFDKYHFAWTLVETGKTRFLIEKDQTSTNAWLHTAYDKGVFFVSMAPENWMMEFARITPAQAKELAGPMRKARRAAALVDQKIKL
jgi:hypothetical protein